VASPHRRLASSASWASGIGALVLALLYGSPAAASGSAAGSSAPTSEAAASSPGVAAGPVTVSVDATHAVGAIDKQLLGVDGPGPSSATTAIKALGLQWVRTDVSFESSFDCATRTWDPSSLDARVHQIFEEGAQPLLIVDYTPSCLAPFSEVPSEGSVNYEPPDVGTQPDGTSDEAIWDALVREMALHEIGEGVRAFEIWNEPDGTFWYGGLPGYLHLYQDTATVLAQAAASEAVRIEVGGPALFFADAAWIEPFLAYVSANGLPLGFLSWHYYGDYPLLGPDGPIPMPPTGTPPVWYYPALRAQTFGEEVTQVRAELASFPSLHPKLWIDEWNVDAGYDARQSGPYDAAFAAAVLDSVQSAGLDRMAFFDVSDSATDPRGNWGLLTSSLALKPVYETFAYWHALGPNILSLQVEPDQSASDPTGRVGAVGAIAPDGTVTVLVYDFAPYDPTGNYGTSVANPYGHSIDLVFRGLRHGTYFWRRALVDGAHDGGVVAGGMLRGPSGELSFGLAGEGVTLLEMRPAR